MSIAKRNVLLVQLPIPQSGLDPARGNVPLAAGYLKMFARSRGLEADYSIDILPTRLANRLGDQALVEAIAARDPWMVGFTCYLWNVQRSLWIAAELRQRNPAIRILLGGPEITADNDWVLASPYVDFAAIGEGEQTFAELLEALRDAAAPRQPIAGLWVAPALRHTGAKPGAPAPRAPLPRLDPISSPYLEGILDASEEKLFLLETIRGCIFKCKFCYYPKSYDDLYFLSEEKIVANLEHARQHGVEEVILLDPTLNQRRDFGSFLRLLADCNPDHDWTYFGELRAEGINDEIARLLRAANFSEVEIGLQSVDPRAQTLMDRRNNMRAFERGVGALLQAGLHVTVDLIVGLPGDTPATVRESLRFVRESGLYSDVQVFNLAVLPGTAFREEAAALGLEFQPRPPYYVLRTPTLETAEILSLMAAAENGFETEFDALPPPHLDNTPRDGDPAGLVTRWRLDLDAAPTQRDAAPPRSRRAQAFTLWLRGADLGAHAGECTAAVRTLLDDNANTTLQVVLEPTASPQRVTPELVDTLLAECYRVSTYLDRFHSVSPGPLKGTKRIVIAVPAAARSRAGSRWIDAFQDCATVAWIGSVEAIADLDAHEYVVGE